MNIKPIRNNADLQNAFERLEVISQAKEGTPECIEVYENKNYPISPANSIDAIKFRMDQQSLTAKDLEVYIGASGRVSEILNGKRTLSLRMIKNLHNGLNIPYDSLLSGQG